MSACNSGTEQKTEVIKDPSLLTEGAQTPEKTAQESPFDLTNVPVSTAELGDFPFFNFPDRLEPQNKPVLRSFDRLFFPIDGVMVPIEGRVWKSNVVTAKEYDESWSLPYFEKSYDEAIKDVGGVKIFEGKVSGEEMDRIKDQASYFGEEGSLDYWNEPVKVYVIRRENGDDVYIQLSGNSASGNLQILQKEALK